MKTNPIQTKLKLLLLGVLSVFALNFSAFADNYTADEGVTTTQTGSSYNDSDPTKSALNVSGEGTTYDGTDITLSGSNNSSDTFDATGKGAYTNNAILFLTSGSITTSGSYGHGVLLDNTSNGTLDNVKIKTTGSMGYGVALKESTLMMTGGSIHTSGFNARGISLDASNVTVNSVNIKTTGDASNGVRMTKASTMTLTDSIIRTSGSIGYGINLLASGSLSMDKVDIETTGYAGHGLYVIGSSTLALTDSDIRVTGSQSYALATGGASKVTMNLDGNTLSSTDTNGGGMISAAGGSTVTLTGSNGSILTGREVYSNGNGTLIDITLTGQGTALHSKFIQGGGGIITLSIGAETLLDATGTLSNLTLQDGAILAFDGGLTVTTSITIGDNILVDLSALAETGDYTLLNWNGATVTGEIDEAQFANTTAGVEGTFTVANKQLVFNATAVPEPSTWFLMGAGLGLLLLTAHYRRRKAQS